MSYACVHVHACPIYVYMYTHMYMHLPCTCTVPLPQIKSATLLNGSTSHRLGIYSDHPFNCYTVVDMLHTCTLLCSFVGCGVTMVFNYWGWVLRLWVRWLLDACGVYCVHTQFTQAGTPACALQLAWVPGLPGGQIEAWGRPGTLQLLVDTHGPLAAICRFALHV